MFMTVCMDRMQFHLHMCLQIWKVYENWQNLEVRIKPIMGIQVILIPIQMHWANLVI